MIGSSDIFTFSDSGREQFTIKERGCWSLQDRVLTTEESGEVGCWGKDVRVP